MNEDTTDIVEAVSNRINSLREGINKLKGCKCYNETKEKFESKEVKINETDILILGGGGIGSEFFRPHLNRIKEAKAKPIRRVKKTEKYSL